MTEIDRHRRVQDLRALLHNLENYRDQEIDFEVDLARIPGFVQKDDRSKQHVVLGKLRERLFEISKRNRLLHFHATMQTVNLTHASVPLSFDITNIRPDQILVWNDSLHAALTGGEPISLNKYLNFAEALYLPSMLDRIMAESRRDQAEFGFGQLRLVICFLHWANLKEKPVERFDSPLVLLPVELKKKKGIRDTYYLEAVSSEAEVNPVVRHQFKQLYDIDLPEVIDLAATNLDQFFDYLAQKIAASEPAVTLNKIDRPRIELIHDKARRKLDQYRRRARLAGRGIRSFQDLDYSYDQANYHPLGITLFSAKIRPPATHLRTVIEEKPRPRSFATAEPEPPAAEKERLLYHLQEGGETNPYVWNFDLCSVTLGNFKYRKMSLVRDYETLLDNPPTNPAFEATFSLAPRAAERQLPPAVPLEERYHVVPSDPTQASAIEEARAGTSYIIQGPPGTGKSQTITNLIADYVARGKRVLFVCEKRAAIDVVYARLRQCGLGDLCCLIHDSQTDKKGFVMDLKQTYEGLLAPRRGGTATAKREPAKGPAQPAQERASAAGAFRRGDAGLAAARRASRCGNCSVAASSFATELPELSPLERERLPDYATWWRHRERIASLTAIVQDIRRDGILAKHPLRRLSPRLAQVDRPLELITGVLQAAEKHFEAVEASLGRCGVPREQWQTLATARLLVDYAKQILPVARIGRMDLLDPASQAARQFAEAEQRFRRQQEALAEARQATGGLAAKAPGGGSAGRHRAGEGLRAELLCLAAARVVAIAADSKRLVRLPLARGPPALVAGARRTREGIRGTGQTGRAAEGDRRAIPARRRRRWPGRPRPAVAPGDPRLGSVARPDSRRVGEGRQGPADRRQDGRSRRAAPFAGRRTGQDHAPARGQPARSTSSRVEASAGGLGRSAGLSPVPHRDRRLAAGAGDCPVHVAAEADADRGGHGRSQPGGRLSSGAAARQLQRQRPRPARRPPGAALRPVAGEQRGRTPQPSRAAVPGQRPDRRPARRAASRRGKGTQEAVQPRPARPGARVRQVDALQVDPRSRLRRFRRR